ncbi:hypothetical protein ACFLRZ_04030, partial [Bacteroidota bacterium]
MRLIVFISLFLFSQTLSAQLSGTYTIGSGGNYPTVDSAVSHLLNTGVNGPVVFNILSGTYTGHYTITEFPGSSFTNTVTFQSSTGDADDVILNYSAFADDSNYVFFIKGGDNLIFNDLTLKATGSNWASLLFIGDAAVNIKFYHCEFYSSQSPNVANEWRFYFTHSYPGLAQTNSDSLIVFDSNEFYYGMTPIVLQGFQNAPRVKDINIVNNTFNVNGSFFNINKAYNVTIRNNRMNIVNQNMQNYCGILGSITGIINVTYNYMNVSTAGTFGLSISNNHAPNGEHSIVANNFLSVSPIANHCYCFKISNCTNFKVLYNSINVFGNLNLSSAILIGDLLTNVDIKNNIFANNANGFATSCNNSISGLVVDCDYNNCYSNGTYLFSKGLNFYTNLLTWQTSTGFDLNTLTFPPVFISNTDLHISNSYLDSAGTTISYIYDDIDGDIRDPVYPDIGADEFNMFLVDVSLNAFTGASDDTCCYGSNEKIGIRLVNAGIDTIDFSQDTAFLYCFSTGMNPFTFPTVVLDSGILYLGDTLDVLITNNFNMLQSGYYKFYAYLSMAADPNHINDTLLSDSINVINIDSFPYLEDFESYPIGLLQQDWIAHSTSLIGTCSWQSNNGANTGSWNFPKPLYDHTYGDTLGKYAWTITNSVDSFYTRFMGPCINLDSLPVKSISFWYYMIGNYVGRLHLDIKQGCNWINDIWMMTGPTQNTNTEPWIKETINLTQFSGLVVFRFRAESVGEPSSNIGYCIDDIMLGEEIPDDAGIFKIVEPSAISLSGSKPVKIQFMNYGSDTLNSVQLNFSINGGSQNAYNWTGQLLPVTVSDTINTGNYSFTYGPASIKAWTSLPNGSPDTVNYNDTLVKDIFICNEILKGTYTIGGPNADFSSFSDAVYILNHCGIDSTVVFLVNSGNYNEQITIGQVPGANEINTVTFRSMSGIADSVNLYYNATSSLDNYVIKFDSADFIRIENISISATNIDYAKAIAFTGNASNNIFKGNIITGSQKQSTSTSIATIYCYGYIYYGGDTANSFINNTINYGSSGIYVELNPNHKSMQPWLIKGNTFNNQYYYGCRIKGDWFPIVDSNIFNENSTTSIEITGARGNFSITKNEIHNSQGGVGIHIYDNSNELPEKSIVANNFIQMEATSDCEGLNIFDSNLVVCFNTLLINGSDPNNTKGLRCFQSDSLIFKNNIISFTGQGYVLYFTSTFQSNYDMDYNDYHYSGNTFASNYGSVVSSLNNWKITTGKEVHSLNLDPLFLSSTDLHTGNPLLNGTAIPIPGITDDIDAELRDSLTPDIGADEFAVAALDAGIAQLVSPLTGASVGNQSVMIIFKNYGLNTLTNVTINWAYNNIAQSPFSWTGNLTAGMVSDTITIDTVSLNPNFNHFKIWTSSPNSGVDAIASNDTLDVNIFGCNGALSGSYSIGGSTASFQTINEAVAALQHCGINGPVVFNINPGIYEEQVIINNILGLSASNNITFQSTNGDSTSVLIQYQPPATYSDYVIKLDDVRFIKFSKLSMKAYGPGCGRIFVITGQSNNIILENCILESVVTGSAGGLLHYASCYMSNENAKGIIIRNNLFIGNLYGIRSGDAGFNQNADSVIIENNTFLNNYQYAVYAQYTDGIQISGNKIDNHNISSGSGIFVRFCDSAIFISKNYIISHGEGININYCDGTIAKGEISNNMISLIYASAGILTSGITKYQKIFYNTVALYQGSGGKCLILVNATHMDVRNNSFSHFDYGLPMEISSNTIFDTADYNNYYTQGYTLVKNGNITYSDLQSYQQASGLETQSISVDPDHISSVNLHIQSAALDSKATPVAGITTDIDGDTRNPITPDIGADENQVQHVDISLIALTSPVHAFIKMGDSISIIPQVKNMGVDTITSFSLIYQYGNLPDDTTLWTGQLLPGQIVTMNNLNKVPSILCKQLLKVFVVKQNDTVQSNDSIFKFITGLPVITPPFTDDFEGQVIWAEEGSKEIWETGFPTALTMDTAHSGLKIWATNPAGHYVHNCDDYLYSPYFNFSSVSNMQLSFYNWFETQVNNDYCKLEYSTDGGQNWLSLGYMGDPKGTNWFTHFLNGNNCWSGSNGGW